MAVVRPAVVGDAEAIASVHVRAWQVGYRGQLPDDFLDGLSIEQRATDWRAGLSHPLEDRTVLVVEDPVDGHVCGFSTVGDPREDSGPAAPGEGQLWAINLEPEAWGRDIGTDLLAGACDALRARGWDAAYLWALETNARARRFYEREGWTKDDGIRDDEFGGQAVREVRYRRDLSRPSGRD
jgi:GNAT superfamily N-acetyltransferase